MSASVREVWNALQVICNKEERGMLSPKEFNGLAPFAQKKVAGAMMDSLVDAQKNRRKGIDPGRDKSAGKQIKEDLSILSKTVTIPRNSSEDGFHFSKPDDLWRIINMRVKGDETRRNYEGTNIAIEYDEEKIMLVLNSDLSRPTLDAPVSFLSDDIEVYPVSIKKIRLRYYKDPQGISPSTGERVVKQPTYGYTNIDNKVVFDPLKSVDFELPESAVDAIAIEMAILAGINLREPEVYQYGMSEKTNPKKEEQVNG